MLDESPNEMPLELSCTPKCTMKLNIVASVRFVSKSESVHSMHSVLDVKQSPSFHLRVQSLRSHQEALAANLGKHTG